MRRRSFIERVDADDPSEWGELSGCLPWRSTTEVSHEPDFREVSPTRLRRMSEYTTVQIYRKLALGAPPLLVKLE